MSKSKQDFRKIFEIDSKRSLSNDERKALFKSIMNDVRRQRVYRLVWTITSVAALIICCFIFMFKDTDSTKELNIQEIATHNEKFFLDSSAVQIASLDLFQEQKSSLTLEGNENSTHSRKMVFNPVLSNRYSTIYVPYGKRQEVLLPDGSSVWLNAGSYLTFSHNMLNGRREVYLNGEGYFDIKHNGSEFIVRTKLINVNVLGTTFNTSSYEDSPYFSIELLSGKVDLSSTEGKHDVLKMIPGEKITIHSSNNKIHRTAGNTGEDILWTKKQLALKNVNMRDVLKKIERVYNVKIQADNEVYAMNINYSGRLNVGEDILTTLSSIYELNDYMVELKEKEVSIKKKK